jgi:hypothetical protein
MKTKKSGFHLARFRRWWTITPLAIGLVVGLAGCANDASAGKAVGQNVLTSLKKPLLTSWPVSGAAPLGVQVAQVVPDPSGNAIWWWGEGANDAHVYEFSTTTDRLSTWSLGNPETTGLEFAEQSALALGQNGIVWVGCNNKLVMLNTLTGSVKTISVPKEPSNSQQSEPQQFSRNPVTALAVNGSGDVAVVTAYTTQIPIYDPSTSKFRSFQLPDGMEANDAAYLSDGTLGIALQQPAGFLHDAVLLYSPDGKSTTVKGVQAAFIIPDVDRFLVGQQKLFWVYPNGTKSAGTGSEASEPWYAFQSTHPTWPMANGHLITVANNDEGLVDLSPTASAVKIVLAKRPCYGPSTPGGSNTPGTVPPTSTPTSTPYPVCHTQVDALTAIGNTVWYLESFDQTFVWRVTGA